MRSVLAALLLALAIAGAWAQDDSVENADPAETEAATDADDDEVEVDDESYVDADDDDFRPSEDIPADQSIAFPADI